MKRILYLGNDLTKKTNYYSTMELLYLSLLGNGFEVIKASDKINKFYRLFDMIRILIFNRNKLDYVLIDTFSTVNFNYAFITSRLAIWFDIKYVPILRGGNLPHRLENSRRMSKAIFANSIANVAPSNYLKYEFEKRGYNVRYIPNILETEKYKFKNRVKLSPRLLYVRAFAHLYNPTMAIHVLKLLKKSYPNAKLCMIGPIKDDSILDVKRLIEDFDLSKDVEITGVLSKEKWHKKSEEYDIFINTTNIDNTPVSVMEAMALGLPVVSTNVGGVPYLVQNGIDGILVDKGDAESMARSISGLIENGRKVEILTKKARQKVEGFSWNVVKGKWLDLIG